jgi:hypothetical protein
MLLKKQKSNWANPSDLLPGSWDWNDHIKGILDKTKKQDSSSNKHWKMKLRRKKPKKHCKIKTIATKTN